MSQSVRIEHDGFEGDVIGHYTTREGKRGIVLQQLGTKVVHVYGERWADSTIITDTWTQLLNDTFDFLGGVDGAADLRARILAMLAAAPKPPSTMDGWISSEREIMVAWLPKLIAQLSTKPDHVDDVARLARLHHLISRQNPRTEGDGE